MDTEATTSSYYCYPARLMPHSSSNPAITMTTPKPEFVTADEVRNHKMRMKGNDD